jgi:16S rRNA processing protein RimM
MGRTADSTSSTDETPREPAEAPGGVALGRVVGVHGLRGTLRVRILGDDPTNLMRVPRVRLGPREGDPEAVEYEVTRVGPGRGGELRLCLDGVTRREQAEALRGRWLLARASDLERLPAGEYYEYELVGCRVEDGQGRALGVVRGIWETGAADVLVVEAEDGAEHLIPAAADLLSEVDVAGRRIVVDAIPGLLPDEPGKRTPVE